MQTFLPYADYRRSAESLDNKRLFKQCVEGLQIFNILLRKAGWVETPTKNGKPMKGFWNHPAVLMWEGHELAFAEYVLTCCQVWRERGGKETISTTMARMMGDIALNAKQSTAQLCNVRPRWFGQDVFHQSHQSNLVRKLPEHYAPQFNISGDLPYVWPVQSVKGKRVTYFL